MNPVPIIDAACVFFFATAFLYALRIPSNRSPLLSKTFLSLCMLIYALTGLSNVLEHSGITVFFDSYEDYLEILFLPFFVFFLYTLSLGREMSDRKIAEEGLRKSLTEKNVLLKEVHHRVKNNMAIISSLLHLQSQNITEEPSKRALMKSRNRIKSMALIHEKIYQKEAIIGIDIKDYVKSLASNLIESYEAEGGQINLVIDIDEINLDIDTLIPAGLILNELISNSLKHAFPNKGKGEIGISLKKLKDNTVSFKVSDNGKGLPDSFNLIKNETLGIQLISSLTKQLKGNISHESNKGVSFSVTFPRPITEQ